jgi:hypothetical protein
MQSAASTGSSTLTDAVSMSTAELATRSQAKMIASQVERIAGLSHQLD